MSEQAKASKEILQLIFFGEQCILMQNGLGGN